MGALGINGSTLIAQIINFVILLALLYLVAYRPILRMFDERSRKIKESMEQTELIKEQAAHAEEEVKKQLEAARREGQAILAQASRMGEQVKDEARSEARGEAKALIAKASLEIQREREESADQLRREFVDLAVLAAEKVIDESLDKKAHQRLIEQALEEGIASRGGAT